MIPNNVFAEAAARLMPQYGNAELNLALDCTEGKERLLKGTLVFLARTQDVPVAEGVMHDYGDLILFRRVLPASQALNHLNAELQGKPQKILGRGAPLEFERSIRYMSYRRPGWPMPFGERKRARRFPELLFALETKAQGFDYRLPLVKPGKRILLDERGIFESWLELEYNDATSRLGELRIILPDYRAAIGAISITKGRIKVDVLQGTTSVQGLRVRCALRHENDTKEMDLTPLEGNFHGDLPTLPLALHVFLTELEGEVIDWAEINLASTRHARGIEIEIPEATIDGMRAAGEGQRVEFKSAIAKHSPKEFLETVVAFANSDGGTILLGVNDEGKVVGLPEIERERKRILEWCSKLIDPPVDARPYGGTAEGKQIVVVEVPPSSQRPHQLVENRSFYVRRDQHDRLMTRVELDTMYGGRGLGLWPGRRASI